MDPRAREHLHLVVIAGGSGTRFWPLSRRHRPKQLLALAGEQTLLAATFGRLTGLVDPSRHWMVVGASHAEASRKAVPHVPELQVLAEPEGKNTAPAVALAAVHLAARDPDAIMAVLPADHHVADGAALAAAIGKGAELAAKGAIVTLGITPGYPETGYGYIERGAPDSRVDGAYAVQRFVEKPDRAKAEQFLARGGFYWNAGIFVLRASRFLEEQARQLPAQHEAFTKLPLGAPDYPARLASTYKALQSISIDYGIMEKAGQVAVVPVDCGWSDVGSMAALGGFLTKDAAGNAVKGLGLPLDSKGCVIYTNDGHLVAVVGATDLTVIHTDDATLVVPTREAQAVRRVAEEIGKRGLLSYL
jgi:mannose-1-phosphate guanylyltransferase